MAARRVGIRNLIPLGLYITSEEETGKQYIVCDSDLQY